MINYIYRNLNNHEVVEKNGNIYHPQNIIRYRTGKAYYFLKKISLEFGDNSYKVVAHLINAKTGKNDFKQSLGKTDKFSERFELINFDEINSEEVKGRIRTMVNSYNRSKPRYGYFTENYYINNAGKPYSKLKLKNQNSNTSFNMKLMDTFVQQLFNEGDKMSAKWKNNQLNNLILNSEIIADSVVDGSNFNDNQILTYNGIGNLTLIDSNPNELITIKKNRKEINKRIILDEDPLIMNDKESVFKSSRESSFDKNYFENLIDENTFQISNQRILYNDMYTYSVNYISNIINESCGIPKTYLDVDENIGFGGINGSVSLDDRDFCIVKKRNKKGIPNNKITLNENVIIKRR